MHTGLIRLCLGAMTVLVATGVAPVWQPAAAATNSSPSVRVEPTAGLADGQALSITVAGGSDVSVNAAVAHVCRDGVTYYPSPALGGAPTAADFQSGGVNCPPTPVSTSADVETNDHQVPNFAEPGGETFLFHVGAGVVAWTDIDGGSQTLTCDPSHSCALVVEVLTSGGGQLGWRPFVFSLTFAGDDPFAGCGSPANGILSSGGSDRMIDAWVSWTRAECKRPGRSGAATRASFVGEGSAVISFASGSLDLAYTAGGYDNGMGLAPADPSAAGGGRRAAVAIPIGLNATVLAVAGGRKVDGHDVPFQNIKLGTDEVATLLSGGSTAMSPYAAAIKERNPELVDLFNTDTNGFLVGAYADPEATSWYATRWLKSLAPDAWKVPDNSLFGDSRGRPRGVDSSLALADPSYANALSLLSGRPALRRGILGVPVEGTGVWVLTDLVTAKALSLVPVQVQNARGDFVAPAPESLAAALPSMTEDDQGVLIADPKATAATGAVQPYPLTMVEYALAPAEPLVDQSCAPRSDSQTLLDGWLRYLVGDGQAALPPGMSPLPVDLRAAASAAIEKVGAAPVTSCTPPATPTTPGAGNAPAGVANSGNDASPSGSGSPAAAPAASTSDSAIPHTASSPSSADVLSVRASTGNDNPVASVAASVRDAVLPVFAAFRRAGWLLTVLALCGLVVLAPLAAFATVRGRTIFGRRRAASRQ